MGLFFWLKIGAIAALLIGLAFAKHGYDERRREEGRQEIRIAAAKETLRQQEAWTRKAQENEDAAKKIATTHRKTFDPLAARAAALIGTQPSSDFARLFDDARRAAETARPAAVAPATPSPAANSTETYVVQLLDWAGICIERDQQWRSFYASLQKGQAP
jgi:hypothetical protein